jgi:hypothetical protein
MDSSNLVDVNRVQYIAIVVSIIYLLSIVWLIRGKRIREEYSLIWIVFGIAFLVLSIWREGLDYISELLGVAYPPTAIFLIFFMAIFLIMIQFSLIISKLSRNNSKLAQDQALLKQKIEELESKLEDK